MSLMTKRQLVMKPTFMNQLHGLTGNTLNMVVEKVSRVAENPLPDGHLKKKIAEFDVYRLRVGDYRIFYTFGDDWVQLLSIEHRKDAYTGKRRVQPGSAPDLPPDTGLEDRLHSYLHEAAATSPAHYARPQPPSAPPTPGSVTERGRSLERAITPDWLMSLKIPPEYHDCLCQCSDEASLLDAPVPQDILLRVLDNLWPRDLDSVQQQADYIVRQAEDLKRYKDGDLLGFLLRLDPDQKVLVERRGRGPAIVKGGPGSGKSTVALYRARWILDQAEAEGRPAPRILFTTYTNALTRFSEQLLEQLLGDRASSVDVSTADRIAWNIVEATEEMPDPAMRNTMADILGQVRRDLVRRMGRETGGRAPAEVLQRLSIDFLLQEFEWVIEGRNLRRLQQYLGADRTGRVLPLRGSLRRAIWRLYQEFQTDLQSRGLTSYGRVRSRALEIVREGRSPVSYDAVIIDEAQDMTPTALALLTELCRDRTLLFLTADGNQSIYSRGFTWNQVHDSLRFTGRTRLLKRNYRTSKQIAEAATAFLLQAGFGDSECLSQEHVHHGPPPVLLAYESDDEQWAVIADFIRRSALYLQLPTRSAAVLVPTNYFAEKVASGLNACGLPARAMRGADLDLKAPEVKVMTLHSAKGLEFPIVVVAGLKDGILPRRRANLTAEELEEDDRAYRRLLFVGFTRAMRALLVAYPVTDPSPFVKELAPNYWQEGWSVGAVGASDVLGRGVGNAAPGP